MEECARLVHNPGQDYSTSDAENLWFLLQFTQVIFRHVPQEANRVADFCAKKGRVSTFAYEDFGQADPAFLEIVQGDVNWASSSLVPQMKELAERRKMEDLTIGPVLTVTTDQMMEHIGSLLAIPGSKLLFGGQPLENHSIPEIYGAMKPTALFVPIDEILKDVNFELVTKEIFGPFQVVTQYKQDQLALVLDACEQMHAHLTAAVVSNDLLFLQEVLGRSVNGTTYAGIRARTTGAPQNHWFGPAGDPRGAGIGTPEAIKLVWSCHREVIYDIGPVPLHWNIPLST